LVNEANKTLGDVVREARVHKELGLRELARRLKKTASYLSDIENDRRVPAEDMLRDLARALELDFDDLMGRAGRLGDDALRYLTKNPAAGVLMRKLSAANASPDLVEKLTKEVDRKLHKPKGGAE
jgi:transcriptional regulator with XRE-family HTH domain